MTARRNPLGYTIFESSETAETLCVTGAPSVSLSTGVITSPSLGGGVLSDVTSSLPLLSADTESGVFSFEVSSGLFLRSQFMGIRHVPVGGC